MNDKTSLRQALLAARRSITNEQRLQWDAAIGRNVFAWLMQHPVKTLGIYWPIRGEPDLQALYRTLSKQGMQLALPKVTEKEAPFSFIPWIPDEPLSKDLCGVLAPESTALPVQPDAILVPCLGFNWQKYRLGYGAGYYDRTLAEMPDTLTVGIAYSNTQVSFEGAAHDIALDLIFTEIAPDIPLASDNNPVTA